MTEAINSNMDENIKSDNLIENMSALSGGTVRDNLVSTAVHFLLNPRIINTRLSQKREFLIKKGLNGEEIDLAIDKAHAFSLQNHSSMTNGYISPQQSQVFTEQMPSFWIRSANLLSSMATMTGLLYGAYVLYKRFVEPYVFGKTRTNTHPYVIIQEQITQLTNAINSLQTNMSTLEKFVKNQIEKEVNRTTREVSLIDLKQELSTIKALLVNRKSFAPPIMANSIPLWQLENTTQKESSPNQTVTQVNGELSSDQSIKDCESAPKLNGVQSDDIETK